MTLYIVYFLGAQYHLEDFSTCNSQARLDYMYLMVQSYEISFALHGKKDCAKIFSKPRAIICILPVIKNKQQRAKTK